MSKTLTIQPDVNLSIFTAVLHPGFQYLGRVQCGMEFGALALTPEGSFVQVNGAVLTPLNASRVTAALRKAMGPRWKLPAVAGSAGSQDAADSLPAAAAPTAPVPVIVKRKRRVPVMP
jgi:hypothetical protein